LKEIATLDKLPVAPNKAFDASIPFSKATIQLSDPAFYTKLPFPFVGKILPKRFKTDPKDCRKMWSYMGREKFKKLQEEFEKMRESNDTSALWLYGTKGYGKSHLLAAFVCYLIARGERVVYLPDCRESIKGPVYDIRAALLLAWADDDSKQREIMTLNNKEEINKFLERHEDAIISADQVNGIEIKDEDSKEIKTDKRLLHECLVSIMKGHKTILSTSANNSYFQVEETQTSEDTMPVYRGLTKVSLDKSGFFTK
jgi:hypothetical protein